ncbi:pseudouridine synthase [uncultured Umboniibacter sp.]|uniref:pseudouridine synthase n=1 Tax=uncultured Umboniibacter sp. TaxID=1798917 RepID=UPI0026094FE8|nr:pseudouridine synthase [uncultured Umboniibacter sp.]
MKSSSKSRAKEFSEHIQPSRVFLPHEGTGLIVDFLAQRFPNVSRLEWLDRIARGRVLNSARQPITADQIFQPQLELLYYREVQQEPKIHLDLTIVFESEHCIVVNKPPFLPVNPGGQFIEETVVGRLVARGYSSEVTAVHQLDRLTEGLVLLCKHAANRDRYHRLFREGRIRKRYEALSLQAPANTVGEVVHHRSKLVRGSPSFCWREAEGAPNSYSRIRFLEAFEGLYRFELEPVTGKTHQLRVHMAAMGNSILNDPFYPTLMEKKPDCLDLPLKLKARSLEFIDPIDGQEISCDLGPINS